jgi:sarcosine oxidase / L-pipecolate oxidase
MWFQFQPPDPVTGRSNLLYGFPVVPWGPPNVARIAIDAATRHIKDPDERLTNVINPADIKDTQDFIKEHVVGVDATVPAFTLSCMQTNVPDNNFVLDYLPEKYLKGGPKDSVALFTAGWAMKFVPTLGRTLKEMMLDGGSKTVPADTMKHFAITRDGVILESATEAKSVFTFKKQAHGSSIGGVHNVGH